MRRLNYIPTCLNLCPLTTFYEEDHNGCQKKEKNNQTKANQPTKQKPHIHTQKQTKKHQKQTTTNRNQKTTCVSLCRVELCPEISIAYF